MYSLNLKLQKIRYWPTAGSNRPFFRLLLDHLLFPYRHPHQLLLTNLTSYKLVKTYCRPGAGLYDWCYRQGSARYKWSWQSPTPSLSSSRRWWRVGGHLCTSWHLGEEILEKSIENNYKLVKTILDLLSLPNFHWFSYLTLTFSMEIF